MKALKLYCDFDLWLWFETFKRKLLLNRLCLVCLVWATVIFGFPYRKLLGWSAVKQYASQSRMLRFPINRQPASQPAGRPAGVRDNNARKPQTAFNQKVNLLICQSTVLYRVARCCTVLHGVVLCSLVISFPKIIRQSAHRAHAFTWWLWRFDSSLSAVANRQMSVQHTHTYIVKKSTNEVQMFNVLVKSLRSVVPLAGRPGMQHRR